MKKLLLITTLLLVFLTGCTQKSEFDKAVKHFEDAESVKIRMVMKNLPVFGDMVMHTKVDGKKTEIEVLGETGYTEERSGVVYSITKDINGNWVEEVEEDGAGDVDFDDLDLVEDDFTLEDGWYVSSEVYDEISNLKIKIENDVIIEMHFDVESKGLLISVESTFSDYGKTVVTIPNVN